MNITNLDLTPAVLSFIKGIDFDVEYNVEQNIEQRKKEAMSEIRDIRSIKPTISQIPLWKVKIDSFVERNKGTITTQLDPEFISLNKLKVNIWNPDYDFQKIASATLINRANTSILETAIAEVQENSFNILYVKFQMILKFLMETQPEVFKHVLNLEDMEKSGESVPTIVDVKDKEDVLPINIEHFNKPKYGTKRLQIKELVDEGIVSGRGICAKLNPPIQPTRSNLNSIYTTLSQMRKNGEIKVVLQAAT